MSKNKWITSPVYTLEYLANEDLTEKDLHNLFDKDSLLYSVVVAQFHEIGDTRRDWELIKECKEDPDWMNKYYFKSEKLRNIFVNKVAKVLMNLYTYKEEKAKREAAWFLLGYGFRFR